MKKLVFLIALLWTSCSYAQDAQRLLLHSKEALEQNKIKEAISYAEEAIRLQPTLAEAYNAKGLAHYAFSEYDKAIAAYSEAIRLNANYKDAFYNRGVCYYWLSKNDAALADFQRAISLDKQDARSYTALGALYAKMSSLATNQKQDAKKYFDLAEKTYQEALNINPEYWQTYFNYASLIADAHPKKALEYLELYQKAKPKDVEALVLMGMLQNQLKEYASALNHLEKAVSLNPNHSEAFLELAWANHQLKRKAEACKNWKKAQALGNTSADTFLRKYCKKL
ncbi:MAG: hypothetical protein OHK0045_00830 [Raineya sp.]